MIDMPILTLAQTDPTVPTLPRPPLLAHYVLEQPWPLVATLVVGGCLAAWLLNQRARARLGLAVGAGLVLLGAAVAIVGSAVTTTRETLIARTVDLIAATARADTAALNSILARDVSLRFYTTSRRYSRDELLGLVRRYPGEQYPVESHRQESLSASVDGPNAARTQVRAITHSTSATIYNVPVGSWWRVEWRREADGEWRVSGLECLQIDGLPAGSNVSP